jgi:hypothetical protein
VLEGERHFRKIAGYRARQLKKKSSLNIIEPLLNSDCAAGNPENQ